MDSRHDTARSVPIHCIIEQADADKHTARSVGEARNQPLVDSYAILPSLTLFSDIVRTALMKLGYSASEAVGAKGSIQIKNWNALSLDQISSSRENTVDDILSDVSSVVTLKIKLCSLRDSCWDTKHVYCAVVSLLRGMSQTELARLSPLSQPIISNITREQHIALGANKLRKFKLWYEEYIGKNEETLIKENSAVFHKSRRRFQQDEVSYMRPWFQETMYPSLRQFQSYASRLNAMSVRSLRPKVRVTNLTSWWSHRRQKLRQRDGASHVKATSVFQPLCEREVDVHIRPTCVENPSNYLIERNNDMGGLLCDDALYEEMFWTIKEEVDHCSSTPRDGSTIASA